MQNTAADCGKISPKLKNFGTAVKIFCKSLQHNKLYTIVYKGLFIGIIEK